MKARKTSRTFSILLVAVFLFAMFPFFSTEALAAGTLSIEPIEDQVARIIVASENGGVDWGCEPLVLTIRASDEEAVLSVSMQDPDLLTGSFSGLNGNVLTLIPLNKVGNTTVTVTAELGEETVSANFKVVVNKYEDTGEYEWGELKIPGAGAVCGYIFHPNEPNILYAQTDVGGAWRFNFETKSWEDITRWNTPDLQGIGQSRGLGIDPTPGRENWIYLAYGSGTLVVSKDRGDTWVSKGTIGISMGGNSGMLRGLGGDNIVCVPNPLPEGGYGAPTIYAVSNGGIRRSTDDAATWTNIASNFGNASQYTYVVYDQNNYDFLVVGAATQDGAYFSGNGGASWAALPGQPIRRSGSSMYFPCKAAFTLPINEEGDRYLFVTYNDSGSNSPGVNDGNGADGCIFRWVIAADGSVKGDGENVTPAMIDDTPVKSLSGTQNRMSGVGMSALSVDLNIPGALIVGTHNTDPYNRDTSATHRGMEAIFRSLDYGKTWFPILCGFNMYGDLAWGEKAPYSAPAVNGEYATNMWENDKYGQTASEYWWEPWTFMHWNFGPKINPFDSDNMFVNSGLGTYVTWNLTAMDELGKLNAEPNVATARGLTVEEARSGLFTTTNGRIDTNRVTSAYTPFKIGNSDTSVTAAQSVKWETAPGLYMTVQKTSGLYSPPSGKNILLTNTWDYPGWAFQSTEHLPWNGWSYAQWIPPEWEYLYESWRAVTAETDPKYLPAKPDDGKEYSIYAPTNRGISGDNTDYPDGNPDIIVSTARTDWHWNAMGGVIISFDGGLIWHNLPDGYADSADTRYVQNHPSFALLGRGSGMPTQALQNTANGYKTSSDRMIGHVCIGADAKTIIWGMSSTNPSIANTVVTKADDPLQLGQTWKQCLFYNASGDPVTSGTARVVSDRVDPDVFYAFGSNTYVSRDGGLTFRQVTITATDGNNFPAVSNIDREIRGEVGNAYNIWVSGNGLYKLTYDKEAHTISSKRVVGNTATDTTFGMTNNSNGRGGLGLGVNGVANGAIYAYGRKTAQNGVQQSGWGVYRSLDGGETWTKVTLSTDNPNPAGTEEDPYLNANIAYADVRGVTGDPRTFGRVYLSQGNVAGGARYGDIVVNLIESGLDEPSALDVSVSTPTIVETLAAYLAITVSGGDLDGLALKAYLQVGDALLYETDIVDGKGRMHVTAAPEKGMYKLVVKTADDTAEGSCDIDVTEYNLDIWKVHVYEHGGKIRLQFNEDITHKSGSFANSVVIDNKTYATAKLDNRTLEVSVDASAVSGMPLAVSGVKYARLFPSYSFTFTLACP